MNLPYGLQPNELPLLDPIGQILLEEVMLMNRLQQTLPIKTVFDVGANVGQWSVFAHRIFANAIIHAFEITPEVCEVLNKNIILGTLNRVRPVAKGLSNQTGTQEIHCSEQIPAVNTILNNPFINVKTAPRELPVIRADEYMEDCNIEKVDFVKIDTQAMEMQVLKGFGDSLKNGNVPVIQFEYTWLSIFSHDLLHDFYAFLCPLGYKIGRLTSRGLEVKPYETSDEDFKGPYYVAVHESVQEKLGIKESVK